MPILSEKRSRYIPPYKGGGMEIDPVPVDRDEWEYPKLRVACSDPYISPLQLNWEKPKSSNEREGNQYPIVPSQPARTMSRGEVTLNILTSRVQTQYRRPRRRFRQCKKERTRDETSTPRGISELFLSCEAVLLNSF